MGISFGALFSKRSLIPGAVLLAFIIVLALVPPLFPQFWMVRLTAILMYIILAVSWTMFSGPTGYMSLATAAFFGVGIYTAAFMAGDFPVIVFVLVGGAISFLIALGVGALTLRLRGIYFAIFTFGLVELIRHVIAFVELEVTGTRGRFVFGVGYTTIFYYMLGIFVLLVLTAYFLKHSRFGLALQSIGEYETAAAHTGVNVTMVKIIVFAISAFFMGAAGAVWATKLYYVDPGIAFNALFSFMPVLMAIFGGMGQIYGPIIGAAVFTLLKEFLTTTLAKYGVGELYMLFFGIILVAAILFMPDGVVGLIQKLVAKWRKGGPVAENADT
jgi:branched-chain amino acid transport system permease protein